MGQCTIVIPHLLDGLRYLYVYLGTISLYVGYSKLLLFSKSKLEYVFYEVVAELSRRVKRGWNTQVIQNKLFDICS